MKAIDYSKDVVPDDYRCSKCASHGVKMWRQYNTVASEVELMCGACALSDQGKHGPIDATGRRTDSLGCRTDQIGELVPAVPTEDGTTFWGYSSVPEPGVDWWRRLHVFAPPESAR